MTRRFALDAAIILLAIGFVVEATLGSDPQRLGLVLPVGVAGTLGLLARARHPLAAPAATLSALVVVELGGVAFSAALVLTGVLTAWLIGAGNDWLPALAGLGLLMVSLGISVAEASDESGVGEFLVWILSWAGAWLGGVAFRLKQEQARQATREATRLAHEQEERARRAIVEERARIARELHDVVAHGVSVMTIQAGGVRQLLGSKREREREALLIIEETGRQALADMRRLLGVLRDANEAPALTPPPGLGRIPELVEQMRVAGLPVSYAIRGEAGELSPGIDVSGYRIVQEALTNALKHARPTRTSVVVTYGRETLEIEVTNDGRSNGAAPGPGHGLVGMRERATLYGGTLEAGPYEGDGYRVRARLPLREPT
jgi:signal transduction histidine kinase